MMSGDGHPSRTGRLTALATLAVSATLFVSALFGIASIDPGANASAPAAPPPAGQSISLDPADAASDRKDCPWRERGRDGARRTS